jgi:hypothetical protein
MEVSCPYLFYNTLDPRKARRNHLRLLASQPHVVPAHHHIEKLIGPAKLDIGIFPERIVSLEHRIEQFVKMDRLAGVDSLSKIITSKKLLDREVSTEFDHFVEWFAFQPFTVVPDASSFTEQYFASLTKVRIAVFPYGLFVKRRSCSVASGWVTDGRCGVADNEDDVVTGVLELTHLFQEHGVAQVKVWGSWIESYFDAEETTGLVKEVWGAANSRKSLRLYSQTGKLQARRSRNETPLPGYTELRCTIQSGATKTGTSPLSAPHSLGE